MVIKRAADVGIHVDMTANRFLTLPCILPHPHARTASYLLSICGQFFIKRIISLQLGHNIMN